MAKGNLAACLSVTLEFEGGYADHPSDPGGATNMGITRKVLAAWRKVSPWWALDKAEVKNLKRAEVEDIYAARYWRPMRGDDLTRGVDLAAFDYGVNSGIARASKHLQAIVGAEPDGLIGPKTLNLIALREPRDIVKALCAKRLSFVQSLAIWNTFGKGWARRIAAIEAKALSWVSSKAQLEADAKAARDKAVAQGSGAAVGTGGGVGVDQAPDLAGLPVWVIVAVVAAIVVPLVIRAIVNAQRAAALNSVAKEA